MKSKRVIEGFFYHVDYCYDDCCERNTTWQVLPRILDSNELNKGTCDECEEEFTNVDWDLLHKFQQEGLKDYHIDYDMIRIIKEALGVKELHDGQYIRAEIECSVLTPEHIILDQDIT